MERPDSSSVLCLACGGTAMDHGGHDRGLNPALGPDAVWDVAWARPVANLCARGHEWRFDKWSTTDAVVWRCVTCNAVAEFAERAAWRAAVDGGYAHVMFGTRFRQLLASELDILPCDVCEGTGLQPLVDQAEHNRVRRFVARRSAKSWAGLMPRVGPLLRARDLAVLSVCPRCGKSDRSIPVTQMIGMETDQRRLVRLGELDVESCIGQTAHYCGRCDLEFGDAGTEFMAGLR